MFGVSDNECLCNDLVVKRDEGRTRGRIHGKLSHKTCTEGQMISFSPNARSYILRVYSSYQMSIRGDERERYSYVQRNTLHFPRR